MEDIYSEIAARTGGNIYIGVVGPVRTGKSTLVKRIMEELVIPAIEDPYRRERARDELPQSGSGRTRISSCHGLVQHMKPKTQIEPGRNIARPMQRIKAVGSIENGTIIVGFYKLSEFFIDKASSCVYS